MATKKSPRSPSLALDDAISKAEKVYGKERRHASPTDVVAQNIGYKSANNGAALAALASLRYYGLLERPKEGHLAVSKDVETYLYAPDESIKRDLLQKWMRSPPVFQEIIEKYVDGLPSDATLRFDLIGMGFSPSAAEAVIAIFKRSADFAGLYSEPVRKPFSEQISAQPEPIPSAEAEFKERGTSEITSRTPSAGTSSIVLPDGSDLDRIPVRLPEGRRAWLIIPSPFFEADKQRLKAQIDLLLTDDN